MVFRNIKGIIWDLDGTLLDSFGIFEEIVADVVAESGHAMPSRQTMIANYHGSLEETVQRVLGIESTADLDQVVSRFLEKQERHYDGDLHTYLFKDALTLARQAASQGVHQMLITNRSHKGRGNASPKYIIAATLLADCIHEVYPVDEVAYRKPDKRSVGDWLQRYMIDPTEVLVIGDQHVDAQLAVNLGAHAVLVKRIGDIPHIQDLVANHNILLVDSLDDIQLV